LHCLLLLVRVAVDPHAFFSSSVCNLMQACVC